MKGELALESQSLSPLPGSIRQGLTAITTLAFISFTTSTILFLYIAYKLLSWHLFIKSTPGQAEEVSDRSDPGVQEAVDFAVCINGVFTERPASAKNDTQQSQKQRRQEFRKRNPPNQFLVLVFNLFLADIHQATAFGLSFKWLQEDAITVGGRTCFAQGLFISLGDLASSCFITFIAVHTYLAVVKGWHMKQNCLYLGIALVWVFVYGVSFIPIAATNSGAKYGGFFVRSKSLCWINRKYENIRLLTHYLFIFISIFVTLVLYLLIFFSLRRRAKSVKRDSPPDLTHMRTTTELQLKRNPAFLIYPIIYILCTLPLAVGRIVTMTGATVPLGYYCFAAAMLASNGTLDCLLFGTTRNVIIFASRHDVDMNDVGLGTFAFMQQRPKRFGNFVFVEGGDHGQKEQVAGGWLTLGKSRRAKEDGMGGLSNIQRSLSQEKLREHAIQMDTVTSVVVEMDGLPEGSSRYSEAGTSTAPSIHGDK